MEVPICFIRVSLLLVVQNLRWIAADCEDKCEQSAGSFSQTGLDNHAMLGHSFKDFTLAKSNVSKRNADVERTKRGKITVSC